MATRSTTIIAGVLAGLTLLTVACGDDDPATTDTSAATTEPAVTSAATPPASSDPADDVPQRVVSLSPTATEMLFAIGAGDQVIAVDEQSDFPPDAQAVRTDLSGFEPNVEAIASYEPDLVVTEGGQDLTEQLEALGIEVWEGPPAATLSDAYAQVEQLGAITGHVAEAAELVASMQSEIQAIAASLPTSEVPLNVYHELDPTLFSADSTTFIGDVYSTLGLRNIADRAEGDSGGYPQLSAEFIISADPDLIFLAAPQETAETVAARPGWEDMRAVVAGNVYSMDPDLASRWGPRVVDYARTVAEAVTETLMPAGG